MAIREKIKQLLGAEAAPGRARRNKEAAPQQAARDMIPEIERLLDSLTRLSAEKRTILSGRLNMVGLQRIRAMIGDDWPRVAARAQDIALRAIQRSCGSDDIYSRYDELAFIIVFGNLTPEQAQLRCHEISEEIGRKLLGDRFSADACEVSTAVVESDGSLLFSASSKADLLDRLLQQGEADDASAVEPDKADEAELVFPTMDAAEALASISIRYRPMWNARHKAIANYLALPEASIYGRVQSDGMLRIEYDSILTPVEFDSHVARSALAAFGPAIAQGQRVLMSWPVHFETLATRKSRQEYLEVYRTVPDAMRQLLILELEGLPEGVPQSRLLDVTTAIRPVCRRFVFRVAPEFRNFGALAGMGTDGVGLNLAGSPADDTRRIATLNAFAAEAAKVRLRCYVHGLSSRAQALAALVAGFEWIDGEAVEKALDLPGSMMRFDLDDLYRAV